MGTRQRLVLCLDGTWNKEDDSTNVLHHFNLVEEDFCANEARDGILQKKKYIRGVGTTALDRFTGGGFGWGIDENVTEAYNWLIQNYEDGGQYPENADEIFIFGFSRGAYTARSLVGFISRCGLLRKGAPFTVNELWTEYGILQRKHEDRSQTFWTKVFGEDRSEDQYYPLRDITNLACDPWLDEQNRRRIERTFGAKNPREESFVKWSRRAQITYLGLYDTVGALGLDALAIPGLGSRMASHHNMRPTTIIKKCRHALALDEHRGNFNHTPFVAYISEQSIEEVRRGQGLPGNPELNATDCINFWGSRIEQQWFAGAHSNIGGGYPDNALAQAPLKWILTGAEECRLRFDHFEPATPCEESPKDSYAEFARPFWALLIRDKRNYRHLVPEGERRADYTGDPNKPGFELKSIREHVDPGAYKHYPTKDFPPNLVNYYKKLNGLSPVHLPDRPRHDWLRGGAPDWIVLMLWACVGVAGAVSVAQLFSSVVLSIPGACLLAALFPFVDWYESHSNFTLALDGPSPFRRARRDSLYWLRAACFVLVVCGALRIADDSLRWGWNARLSKTVDVGTWLQAFQHVDVWRPNLSVLVASVTLSACMAIVGVKLFRDGFHSTLEARRVGWSWPFKFALLAPAVAVLATTVHRIMPGLAGSLRHVSDTVFKEGADVLWKEAGALLLLELAFLLCINAWVVFVEQPLDRANLRSLKRLRRCLTMSQIEEQFFGWRLRLESGFYEVDHGAGRYTGKAVHEALLRDVLGFVPLFGVVVGFTLWFAQRRLIGGWPFGSWLVNSGPVVSGWTVPVWLWVPLSVALINWVLDGCHLICLKCSGSAHSDPAHPPLVLPWVLSLLLSLISLVLAIAWWIAFAIVMGASAFVVLLGNEEVIRENMRRGVPSLIVTLLAVAAVVFVIVLVGGLLYKPFREKRARERSTFPPPGGGGLAVAASAGGTGASPNRASRAWL